MTPTMATRAVTPPTEMSMLPVIMTMVRPQEMMMRKALSLSMSKSICGLRKPPPQISMASTYIETKMQIVIVRSSWVSVMGSLRRTV